MRLVTGLPLLLPASVLWRPPIWPAGRSWANVPYYREHPLGDALSEKPVAAPPPAGFSADERRVQQFSPVRTAGRSCFVVTPNDVDMVSGALDVVKTHKVPGDAATDLYSYIREKRIFPSQYTDEAGATRWRPCEVELPIRDLCTILSVRPWTALASP